MEALSIIDEEPKHIKFFKERGVKDLDEYIKTKDEKHNSLVKALIENDVLQQVENWTKFVKELKHLRNTPFMKDECGSSFENMLKVRKQLYSVLLRLGMLKDLSSTDDKMKREIDFAAWIMFQIKNSSVYLPIHYIKMFCAKQGICLEDFFDILVKHPEYSNLYTSKEIRFYETTIEKWLQNAKSFDVEPPAQSDHKLDEAQSATVCNILSNPFSVLQGNAGCGKTTTICVILKQLLKHSPQHGMAVVAAAFTHKAKKCIKSRLDTEGLDGVNVSTVHALVTALSKVSQKQKQPTPGEKQTKQQEIIIADQQQNPMKKIFLVLDESSMLDIDMLGKLANEMIRCGCEYQLCFVGDFFQLQPVGRGEIFRKMVEQKLKYNELTKCYRTDNEDLFNNYQRVRNGQVPYDSAHFKMTTVDDERGISSELGKHIRQHLDDFQIICWQNKHIWMINNWVQKALLDRKRIGPEQFKTFYKNDKVVYIGDNDELLTNAMNGVVVQAAPSSMIIEWENGKRSKYSSCNQSEIRNITLSYAISAHKSQGSEYPKVLVACYEVEKMSSCLDRRWFYTSITRAQSTVKVITTEKIKDYIEKPLNKCPIDAINLPR